MNIQNNGRVVLADLAIEFASKEVRTKNLTNQKLGHLSNTVLAARWAPDAVRKVGSGRINNSLQALRSHQISPVTYATVRGALVGPIRKNTPRRRHGPYGLNWQSNTMFRIPFHLPNY